MVNDIKKKAHLIDDQGVYDNKKPLQAAIFITTCRIVTVVLVVLGVLALVVGYT